jgi:hypothetical protein
MLSPKKALEQLRMKQAGRGARVARLRNVLGKCERVAHTNALVEYEVSHAVGSLLPMVIKIDRSIGPGLEDGMEVNVPASLVPGEFCFDAPD